MSSDHPLQWNRVRSVWAHRTASEYRSAAVAAEFTHWTLKLGLSPDTIRLAHRVCADELDHAELCFDIYQAAGGPEAMAPVPPQWLQIAHEPESPLLLRALAVAADEYAVAETVALHLFKQMSKCATAPQVVPALHRIVEDEARHSRLGWQATEELLERAGPSGAAFLDERIDSYIARVRSDYTSTAAPSTELEVAWGLMDPARYGAITDHALGVVRDRFDRLV